jgi:hypothetical protein
VVVEEIHWLWNVGSICNGVRIKEREVGIQRSGEDIDQL